MRKTLSSTSFALSSLVVLLFVPTIALAKVQTMNGDAVVRSIGGNRVAVLLDTNSDQAIDQGFLLESDLPIPATGEKCLEASVEYTESYVRVTYNQQVIDLWVAGYPEPPVAPEETDSTKFIGSSLLHSSGDGGCTLERAMSDAGACFSYAKQ